MDEIRTDLVVGPLTSWPTAELQRVYRLVTADVRAKVLAGAPTHDIAASEEEAAMFGDELVRRGDL